MNGSGSDLGGWLLRRLPLMGGAGENEVEDVEGEEEEEEEEEGGDNDWGNREEKRPAPALAVIGL